MPGVTLRWEGFLVQEPSGFNCPLGPGDELLLLFQVLEGELRLPRFEHVPMYQNGEADIPEDLMAAIESTLLVFAGPDAWFKSTMHPAMVEHVAITGSSLCYSPVIQVRDRHVFPVQAPPSPVLLRIPLDTPTVKTPTSGAIRSVTSSIGSINALIFKCPGSGQCSSSSFSMLPKSFFLFTEERIRLWLKKRHRSGGTGAARRPKATEGEWSWKLIAVSYDIPRVRHAIQVTGFSCLSVTLTQKVNEMLKRIHR
ncbi:hypothetical protein HPB51_027796 [Rhipicephalus microplus]|uniref:Uncharacterized protein n=1 Tax=Rhipicephalus microplus TaxID=6941 RepID=A0A9J6CZ99_RHIMP|nr:hypothetical protein HPB51_027796 [Rhipicephalus microplus]